MADKPLDLVLNYIKASAKRAPFVTEKGHLGLSSWHAKPGDIVALIHGAQVPFILRHHRNGKYRIVSEAYVDGIMDGEAAQNADWQKLEFV
ncbi:hypothetical protein EJ04DRAFT_490318 [Polyplosphaeria fusca]|uniref:Uncharacterized protein n=1 Tax=Polyplosphaeria fusca TaxID=682080 RepID=A0A9P4R3S7_9PLEO|nr:hypothetical protein EJ04DRAFT_490318 [Polyplosphaeria fusca]